jgi:hypothetical protein
MSDENNETIKSVEDVISATDALRRWFISQKLDPLDAMEVMGATLIRILHTLPKQKRNDVRALFQMLFDDVDRTAPPDDGVR